VHVRIPQETSRRSNPISIGRSVAARPVLTQEQVNALNARIIRMTSADTATVFVTHTARVVTRFANGRILITDDGDELEISITTLYGTRGGVWTRTNQLDDTSLRAIVARCEAMARAQMGGETLLAEPMQQDHYLPVALWHDATVRAMTTSRATVVPAIVDEVSRHGLTAAGFVGIMARAQAVLTKAGIHAYCEETDSEVTVTARSGSNSTGGSQGASSGWAGQAARDWSTVDVVDVAHRAAEFALRGRNPQAVEPGRRTAILGPAAVAQLLCSFAQHLDAFLTDSGGTGFSKSDGGGNKLRQRVFDPRITMRSDPADPDGGYPNYFLVGSANPQMTWVERGVLTNLAYSVEYALGRGKMYAEDPDSIRVDGGSSSIDAMIANCREGIYVNRLSGVELIDLRSGLMTGVTRDGCFLVKDGKIDRPVKNFRILDSPFFFLNKLVALGPTARAPFGYAPPGQDEPNQFTLDWPRRPMIVPPMMVRDFNFSSLADAV